MQQEHEELSARLLSGGSERSDRNEEKWREIGDCLIC
jgi:hypothetical protein